MTLLKLLLLSAGVVAGVTTVNAMQPKKPASKKRQREDVSRTCEIATQTDPLEEVLLRDVLDQALQEIHERIVVVARTAPEESLQLPGIMQRISDLLPQVQAAMNMQLGRTVALMRLQSPVQQLISDSTQVINVLRPILRQNLSEERTLLQNNLMRMQNFNNAEQSPEVINAVNALYQLILDLFAI